MFPPTYQDITSFANMAPQEENAIKFSFFQCSPDVKKIRYIGLTWIGLLVLADEQPRRRRYLEVWQ